MSRKEALTPLEQATPPIWGLFFEDGDQFQDPVLHKAFAGKKLPSIEFPSGYHTDLEETSEAGILAYIWLFEQINLPLVSTRDQTYDQLLPICEHHGYLIRKIGDHQLELDSTYEPDEHFIVTYSPATGRIANIEPSTTQVEPLEHAPSPSVQTELQPTPTVWVSVEDIRYVLASLRQPIPEISQDDVNTIARKVTHALLDDLYWVTLEVIVEAYFHEKRP